MKKIIFVSILVVFAMFFSGCGGQLLFQPDISFSGGGSSYYYEGSYPYGVYYEYSFLTLVNSSLEGAFMVILADGKDLGSINPGQRFALNVKNYFRVGKQIGIVVLAYKNHMLVGSASRTFYFYGDMNNKKSETWVIYDSDFRR